jgi:beta-lysine 5,6-aminomutase alpha subunit
MEEPKLDLDTGLIESCRVLAAQIADRLAAETAGKTTVSVERTVTRFLGVDGISDLDVPLPNVLVEHVHDAGGLSRGVAYWLGNAMLLTGRSAQEVAEAVSTGRLDLCSLPLAEEGAIRALVTRECEERMGEVARRADERREIRERLGEGPTPLRYMLSGTGNVYEDVVHSVAVAEAGGDVVSVTRSTAQSLLEHVPYGPTTEGYGGSFATQENFRIMREGLDEWCERNGRYVRLSSFCSGLCMSEFATLGAMEGLDNMVNDALYGILYRDINPVRTMIDQRVSRTIAGYFGIVINTGEDNYLRTAEALSAAPSVTASQFINHRLALDSGMRDHQVALGDAFEIDPPTTNGLLFAWAQAQLTRELFPGCPIKYMPPTRHMDGNLFRTHACDTLFNLITVATGQGIQTAGIPTEGVFTPHMYDRVVGLECVDYVFNFARDVGAEIQFKPGGLIQTRASDVLRQAHELLGRIAEVGMFGAIEDGTFGDVRRSIDEGRGIDGIVPVDERYFNPTLEVMRGAGVV